MVEVFGIQLLEKESFLVNKDKWFGLLDESKKKKIAKLVSAVDSQRSLMGEILIRSILCQRLQLHNSKLIFDYNENAKPYLKGGNIHFNISHSGEWVVCAISEKPVGIDVEKKRKLKLDIAERYFSPKEVADLSLLSADEKQDYFFTLWTIKESYLKLLGKGLTKALNTFTVVKSGNGFHIQSESESLKEVNIKQYDIGDSYKLAATAYDPVFSDNIIVRTVDEYLNEIR